jgi:hypothetical protein
LELAFQNALEGCGTEELTTAKLYERIMEGVEAQMKFRGLKNRMFEFILNTGGT